MIHGTGIEIMAVGEGIQSQRSEVIANTTPETEIGGNEDTDRVQHRDVAKTTNDGGGGKSDTETMMNGTGLVAIRGGANAQGPIRLKMKAVQRIVETSVLGTLLKKGRPRVEINRKAKARMHNSTPLLPRPVPQ